MESACWVVSCATYLKECVHRIESDPDLDGNLLPHRTPLPEVCHRELDDGNFLSELGIRKFQMLISMAQWAVTIGRLDISFAVSFLSQFSAAPCEHHLELAYYLFGYPKNTLIAVLWWILGPLWLTTNCDLRHVTLISWRITRTLPMT